MRALAGVVVALAACGDSLQPAPDAGPPDAADGVVRVRVLGPDNTGLRVFFQNADSSLVLATRTGSDGTANAFMAAGGFVTVEQLGDLWTWGGVAPGDELVLPGLPPPDPPPERVALLSVPVDPDATSYWLHTPCTTFLEVTSARISPLPVSLPGCGDRTDMVVVTRAANFSTIAHAAAVFDVALGTAAAPAVISLAGPYAPPVESEVRLANVPGGIGFVYVRQEIRGTHGVAYDTALFSTATIDTVAASSTTLTIPLPQDATLATYIDDTGSFSSTSLRHAVTWGPRTATTLVDLAPLILPLFAQAPFYDASIPGLIWREGPATVVPEAVLAELAFPAGNRWHVLGPRGLETALRMPVLPVSGLAGQLNESTATVFVSIHSSTGYAAYREHLLGWSPRESWPITGLMGVVGYSEFRFD